ncbi:hypothetical protein VPHD148_0273 [Vibrio phage D148]
MSSTRSPWYRNWLMCRKMKGYDLMVDAILDGHLEPSVLKECKDIYEDRLIKIYVEASLLATEDFELISNTLEIDKHVLMVYHDIYYNVHSLSRIHKTKHLSKIEDADERSLKQWSMTNGMDFIQWRMGLTTKISAMDSVISLQADAYYRSKEAFFNSNTTTASVEGLKWSKQAVHLTRLLAELEEEDTDEGMDELSLQLERITEENIDLPSLDDLE